MGITNIGGAMGKSVSRTVDRLSKGTAGGAKKANPQAQVNRQYGTQEEQAARARASAAQTESGNRPNPLAPTTIPMGGKVPPGALPDVEDASWGQLLGLAAKLLPGGIGFANDAEEGYDALTSGNMSGVSRGGIMGAALDDALGDTPGKQSGWRPDRYRGTNSMGGIGGSGGAVSDSAGDSRSIPGRRVGAGTQALTGDPEDIEAGPGGPFSDVMLRDRRRPRGAGTQMLLA